ncbi:hypothetical protein N2600_09450 [Rhizobium sp. WSM1274]|uniref:hypothetical protein n=1 Tax=unclassified Rhizobium TaxID=2613769 RepID=UPI0021A8D64C|nr:hypothetical protein [Rhizobium leguminosarum]UWM83360.1 hypothetical protein N2A41_08985 [Rhizobium leguminosarum bv. viciae]UWU30143.1 hypothetical protein N2600_09450 [Rhizobium leguminosarum bv. viciae]
MQSQSGQTDQTDLGQSAAEQIRTGLGMLLGRMTGFNEGCRYHDRTGVHREHEVHHSAMKATDPIKNRDMSFHR